MTEEEKQLLKDLYDGKYFYKIELSKDGNFTLYSPYDNIFYKEPVGTGFVQVIQGRPVGEFEINEILVSNQKLAQPRPLSEVLSGCAIPTSYCAECSCGKKELLESGNE